MSFLSVPDLCVLCLFQLWLAVCSELCQAALEPDPAVSAARLAKLLALCQQSVPSQLASLCALLVPSAKGQFTRGQVTRRQRSRGQLTQPDCSRRSVTAAYLLHSCDGLEDGCFAIAVFHETA